MQRGTQRTATWVISLALLLSSVAYAQAARTTLRQADAAMQAGRYAEAAAQYEAWLKQNPQSREALLALGVCYVQMGRRDEAVARLREYVRHVPASAAGHAALGIALLDPVSNAEARQELQRALRLNPKQADAAEALARLLLTEGQPQRAVDALKPAVDAATGAGLRALYAEALVSAGQPQAAAEMFEKELAAKPHSPPQTYAIAAWARLKSGNAERAAEIAEQGMRMYPNSEITGVYLALPRTFFAQRIGERIQRVQEAPDPAELIALARVMADADPGGKTRAKEIATRMLEDALRLAPNSPSAHYNYGLVMKETNDAAALAAWSRALQLQPEDELRILLYSQIAELQYAASKLDEAEKAHRAALEASARVPRYRPEVGLEYFRFLRASGRAQEAEALLRHVLTWNPLFPPARAEQAKLMAERGEWARVVEEGEFVLRNSGDDKELARSTHALLARAYHQLKQPAKAQLHQAQAARTN